jgi:hypothetical protein
MGLPLIVLAFGENALPAAVVLLLVENMLHFSLGVWMLDHHARLSGLWRNPVVQAGAAGLAVSLSGIQIWPPLMLAIKMLGDVSIPLLLFSLGVRLIDASLRDLRDGMLGAVATPVAGMLAAAAIAPLLGLTEQERNILFVFGALPPAVLNFIFAERFHQEPEKVASIVMIGNVAALVFVSIALALSLK